MLRTQLSLILPDERRRSLSSETASPRPWHHVVQSAEHQSSNDSFFDGDREEFQWNKRRKSSALCAAVVFIELSSSSRRPESQIIRAGTCLTPLSTNVSSARGETLVHLAARLGHEQLLRTLIGETCYATRLTNGKGQTPLLCAVEAGFSSTATLLMETDPLTLTVKDRQLNSVFHYAANLNNDIVLSRALLLLKRFNSPDEISQALSCLVERNQEEKTAFLLCVEKGSLRCVRLLLSDQLLRIGRVSMSSLINGDCVRAAIDCDRLDIVAYWFDDDRRLETLLHVTLSSSLNALEYSIEKEKTEFVRLFISHRVRREKRSLDFVYKRFLCHYNPRDRVTPIQRLLSRSNLVHLVPLLLDQFFLGTDGADFSVLDDCIYARPSSNRCLFGHQLTNWSVDSWLDGHPLTLVARACHHSIDDHALVRLCVDLKYDLFGNALYFVIACGQIIYVSLYTGVLLASPTPAMQSTHYYALYNDSCLSTCFRLSNDVRSPLDNDTPLLRVLRTVLLILSCFTLIKEVFQLVTQREKYFQKFFINLLEVHMYVSGILYALDINECTRRTGFRCHVQWEIGAVGLLSVWTSLLLVLMQGIQFGKHGLLFITVLLTFLKFFAYYIFIWIGYTLSLYVLLKDVFPQFRFAYVIPKLLVMLIGEYDLDSTFFPNNEPMPGSEGALVVFSAFIFTMFIVMSNIMGGLAVADVKEFRLNAKRDHLRARIETILSFQAKFGLLCETCSKLLVKLSHHCRWSRWLFKYEIDRLELRVHKEEELQVACHTGIYRRRNSREEEPPPEKTSIDRITLIVKKQDQLKESLEDSTLRTNDEFRRFALQLRTDLDDLKRRLD